MARILTSDRVVGESREAAGGAVIDDTPGTYTITLTATSDEQFFVDGTTSTTGAQTMKLGRDGTGTNATRGVFTKFTGLPVLFGATINSVSLKFTVVNNNSADFDAPNDFLLISLARTANGSMPTDITDYNTQASDYGYIDCSGYLVDSIPANTSTVTIDGNSGGAISSYNIRGGLQTLVDTLGADLTSIVLSIGPLVESPGFSNDKYWTIATYLNNTYTGPQLVINYSIF